MRILVTGGFGNVGRSAVGACLSAGHAVTIFESPGALRRAQAGLRKLLNPISGKVDIFLGDIRSMQDVEKAFSRFEGGAPDAVIHLVALIPPAADRDEKLTREINVGGTANIVRACEASGRPVKLVFASSIATYGDRLHDFWISATDPASPTDTYSRTKVECEKILRDSSVDWTVLRLSYVVWAKWLPFDPLLFAMPPDTRIEIIHTEDAGRAFAHAAANPDIRGKIYDIGGGQACRTMFRPYLDRVFRYFGLGDSSFLDDSAFAKGGFHCGWYADSDESDRVLKYRRKSLEDYYEEVRWETRFLSPLVSLARPAVKHWLARKSPFSPAPARDRAAGSPARFRLSRQEKR
jgi:nucleoside-diphosphate-sugar epimerase